MILNQSEWRCWRRRCWRRRSCLLLTLLLLTLLLMLLLLLLTLLFVVVVDVVVVDVVVCCCWRCCLLLLTLLLTMLLLLMVTSVVLSCDESSYGQCFAAAASGSELLPAPPLAYKKWSLSEQQQVTDHTPCGLQSICLFVIILHYHC